MSPSLNHKYHSSCLGLGSYPPLLTQDILSGLLVFSWPQTRHPPTQSQYPLAEIFILQPRKLKIHRRGFS